MNKYLKCGGCLFGAGYAAQASPPGEGVAPADPQGAVGGARQPTVADAGSCGGGGGGRAPDAGRRRDAAFFQGRSDAAVCQSRRDAGAGQAGGSGGGGQNDGDVAIAQPKEKSGDRPDRRRQDDAVTEKGPVFQRRCRSDILSLYNELIKRVLPLLISCFDYDPLLLIYRFLCYSSPVFRFYFTFISIPTVFLGKFSHFFRGLAPYRLKFAFIDEGNDFSWPIRRWRRSECQQEKVVLRVPHTVRQLEILRRLRPVQQLVPRQLRWHHRGPSFPFFQWLHPA